MPPAVMLLIIIGLAVVVTMMVTVQGKRVLRLSMRNKSKR